MGQLKQISWDQSLGSPSDKRGSERLTDYLEQTLGRANDAAPCQFEVLHMVHIALPISPMQNQVTLA